MGSKPVGISASRGASVISKSKYGEPVSSWCKIMEDREPGFCEKNGYPVPEFVDNADTRWGLALEPYINHFAEYETGMEIVDHERFFTHPEYDFITCHIDGRYDTGKQKKKINHEAKKVYIRTFSNEWGEPGTDHIPRGYTIQTQHQMLLSGADETIVSALVIPKDADSLPDPSDNDVVEEVANGLYRMGYFHQYVVKKNERLQNLMVSKYLSFWVKNILGCVAPEPESLKWVKDLIPEPSGTIIATDQIERWSTERSSIMSEIKTATSRKEELSMLILDFMRKEADREGVCIDNESTEKLILLASNGFKLHSYNGKTFR